MRTYSSCLWVKLDCSTSEQCDLFLWTLLHTQKSLNSSQLMTANTPEVYRHYAHINSQGVKIVKVCKSTYIVEILFYVQICFPCLYAKHGVPFLIWLVILTLF